MFSLLLGLGVSAVIVYFGYSQARRFVAARLRYVDAVNNPVLPVLVGGAAALVAIPIAGLLPIVTTGTAIAFGISVGMGVAAGRGDIRRSLPPGS